MLGPALDVLPTPPGATRACGLDADGLWGFDPDTGARELLASGDSWYFHRESRDTDADLEAVWLLARPVGPEVDGSATALWRCDGTVAGSGLVRPDLPLGTRSLAPTPTGIYAQAGERVLVRVARDGSAVETVLALPPTANGEPTETTEPSLLAVGSHVFFATVDDEHGRELWAVRWDDEIFHDGFESGDTSAWSP